VQSTVSMCIRTGLVSSTADRHFRSHVQVVALGRNQGLNTSVQHSCRPKKTWQPWRNAWRLSTPHF
jgi:hypothetical protein